jgi:hypothetical protein
MNDGKVLQFYLVKWEDDKGHLRAVSVSFTSLGDYKTAAKNMCKEQERVVKMNVPFRGCSTRELVRLSFKCNHENAFPLGIFVHGEKLAYQGKYFIRRQIGKLNSSNISMYCEL